MHFNSINQISLLPKRGFGVLGLSGNSEGSESDPPAPQALTPHMPWKMRLHAIMGAARALVYLHASEVTGLIEA